jgi:hypothetical protein
VPSNTDDNEAMEEFRAHLETLTFIKIDPRLRSKFGRSDIVQNTLLEAWLDRERIQALDAEGRKRLLRRMLRNNLLQEIEHWRAQGWDVAREQSLDAAVTESACRLREEAGEDSSPSN